MKLVCIQLDKWKLDDSRMHGTTVEKKKKIGKWVCKLSADIFVRTAAVTLTIHRLYGISPLCRLSDVFAARGSSATVAESLPDI